MDSTESDREFESSANTETIAEIQETEAELEESPKLDDDN